MVRSSLPFFVLTSLLLATPALAQKAPPRDSGTLIYRSGADGPSFGRQEKVRAVQRDLGDTLEQLRLEVRALDELVDAAGNRGVQREIHRKTLLIEELTDHAQMLADQLGAMALHVGDRGGERPPGTVVIIQEPAPPPVEVVIIDDGPIACSSSDFAQLLRAVGNESFPDNKMTVVRDAARHRWFTVGQVIRLMETQTFSSGKVDLAVDLHRRTVDVENWYQVYSTLTFSGDKDELRRRLGE